MDSRYLSQLRVFISSTFEDLEEERKYLAEAVFPAFTNTALLHGIQFVELDLRWGVPKDAPVIKSCLKEIERTQPYFIGIIGKSDGTVPELENLKAEYGIFDDEYNEKIERWIGCGYSITEMEFLYGAIEHGDTCKSGFFWLDYCPHTPKQYEMRKVLLDKGFNVVPCASIEILGEKIMSFLKGLLPPDTPSDSKADELQAIRTEQDRIREQLLQFYVPRTDFDFSAISSFLDSEKKILYVRGGNGAGKSTILARFLKDYQGNDSQRMLISHFHRGGFLDDIYLHFLLELEKIQGYTYENFAEKEGYIDNVSAREKLKRFLSTASHRDLIFMIDGLEYEGTEVIYSIISTFAPYDNCKLIITDQQESEDFEENDEPDEDEDVDFEDFFDEYEEDDNLDDNEEDEIVVCYPKELTRAVITQYYRGYERTIQDDLLGELEGVGRSWDFHSLRAILHEIRVFGIHNTLSSLVRDLANGTDEEMYEKIISHWKTLLAPIRENDVLEVLYLSHYGLTENTLRELCHLMQHEWSLIYAVLQPYIIHLGDRICLGNEVFREVIRDSITKEKEYSIRCMIIHYFKDKEHSDEKFDEYPYQMAKTVDYLRREAYHHAESDENPYYMEYKEQTHILLDYLIDLDIFHYAYNHRNQELLRYWGGLDDDDSDYMDIYAYLGDVGYDVLARYLNCPAPKTEGTTRAEVLKEVIEFINFSLKPKVCDDYDLIEVNRLLAEGIEEDNNENKITNIQEAEELLARGIALSESFGDPEECLKNTIEKVEPELNELLSFYEMNKELNKLKPYWNSDISIEYFNNLLQIPEKLYHIFDIWVRAKTELLYALPEEEEVRSCYDSVISTMDRVSGDLNEKYRAIILTALEFNYGRWFHDKKEDYFEAQDHLHKSFVLRLKVLKGEDRQHVIKGLIKNYHYISSCQLRTHDYDVEKEAMYAKVLEEHGPGHIHPSVISQALSNCAASYNDLAQSAGISQKDKEAHYRNAIKYYAKSLTYLKDKQDLEMSIKIHYNIAYCKEALGESYEEDRKYIQTQASQVSNPDDMTQKIMEILEIE